MRTKQRPSVVVPIVHLNGTGREALLSERFDALDALHAAGDAIAKAAPNGRDHYPNGPEYCEAANRQHDRRIGILKSLIAEFETELESLQE